MEGCPLTPPSVVVGRRNVMLRAPLFPPTNDAPHGAERRSAVKSGRATKTVESVLRLRDECVDKSFSPTQHAADAHVIKTSSFRGYIAYLRGRVCVCAFFSQSVGSTEAEDRRMRRVETTEQRFALK